MIRGDRLTLRPIRHEDLPHLRAWHSDPAIMTGWALPSPLVPDTAFEDDLRGRFGRFDESGYLVIEAENRPIGRIDFDHLDQRHGTVEIALYIGDVAAQGRGLASDALRALAAYLFSERGVHRIELTVAESNERARKLYESAGFRTEGVLRDHVRFNGRYHDEILMALFAGDLRSPRGNRPSMTGDTTP